MRVGGPDKVWTPRAGRIRRFSRQAPARRSRPPSAASTDVSWRSAWEQRDGVAGGRGKRPAPRRCGPLRGVSRRARRTVRTLEKIASRSASGSRKPLNAGVSSRIRRRPEMCTRQTWSVTFPGDGVVRGKHDGAADPQRLRGSAPCVLAPDAAGPAISGFAGPRQRRGAAPRGIRRMRSPRRVDGNRADPVRPAECCGNGRRLIVERVCSFQRICFRYFRGIDTSMMRKRPGTGMAQRVNVILVDDLDGSDATETVTFGIDGVDYEIDLNDATRPRCARPSPPTSGGSPCRRPSPRQGGLASGAPRRGAPAPRTSVPERGRTGTTCRSAVASPPRCARRTPPRGRPAEGPLRWAFALSEAWKRRSGEHVGWLRG